MARTLVVYYSRTGNTRRLAHELRDLTEADVEELAEATDHTGTLGWVRCATEALLRRRPALLAPVHDPRRYDLVFVGGPVWMGRLAPAVRAYVADLGHASSRLAFFSTQAGVPSVSAWEDLERIGGVHPVATYAERVRPVADAAHRAELERFIARARRGHVSTFDHGAGTPRPAHG